MDRTLDHRVRSARVHDIQNTVNGFIATDSQDRCPQNLLRVRIYKYFHEPLGLPLLPGPSHVLHQTKTHQGVAVRAADLIFGQSDPSERRIDEQPIAGESIADAARIVIIEEIGGHNFVIIVSRMGKGTSSITVSQGPDSGCGGSQVVIHFDVATLVDVDTCTVQPEIFGVGLASESIPFLVEIGERLPWYLRNSFLHGF